jgi:hypothetical protein
MYYLTGFPRSIRAGSVTIAQIKESTPSTAMPRIRKGKRSNQTTGYAIRANNASGQQKMRRRNQSMNVIILYTRVKYGE